MLKKHYQPADIETEIQAYWEQEGSFQIKEDINKEKYYCLSMMPYPSGELHMGHVRNYTIGDVIARYQRMQGRNVLQPMSWDAFGLPAENAAIKNKTPPAKWTYQNIHAMRRQLKRMGFAIDWHREFATCDPAYYAWEQWLFIRLYHKGLVYRKKAYVNWDPVDQTVLSNEQVVNGRGWRSGAPIERREVPQWFLKITAYAEELLNHLDQLEGWPEEVKTMQRNWIGQSHGATVRFPVLDKHESLSVYTTRPDTLMGVTFLAIAPEHPLAHEAAQSNPDVQTFIETTRHRKVAEAELATAEKEGIKTPFQAQHPLTGETLDIWIANYVLIEYGEGIIMAVPAHDQRDYEFAQRYQIPIKPVIQPKDGSPWDFDQGAFVEKGLLFNSGEFDGLSSEKASQAIIDTLQKHELGDAKIQYRLRDWGISRQRYWGAPIPMIFCNHCGTVPVPENELPVELPTELIPRGKGSPLKTYAKFYKTSCPQCGNEAQRETDTFDTFMESSWYYARFASYDQHDVMLDDRANYWLPVDQYIGGIEHAVLHLLYARFMHKVLRDEGLVNSDEPFTRLLTQGMVLNQGIKMSKSKGNVVSPQHLIEQYGADTVRLFVVFAAPPEQSLEWSDSGIQGAHRFLKRIWHLAYQHQSLITLYASQTSFNWQRVDDAIQQHRYEIHQHVKQAEIDIAKHQHNTVAAAAMKIMNTLQSTPQKEGFAYLMAEGFSLLLRLLAPIVPHIAQYLWRQLGYGRDIALAAWPKPDHKALRAETITMVVQINGKRRSQISVPAEAAQDEIEALALKDENIKRRLEGKIHKKIIVVPQKLVNIVV